MNVRRWVAGVAVVVSVVVGVAAAKHEAEQAHIHQSDPTPASVGPSKFVVAQTSADGLMISTGGFLG